MTQFAPLPHLDDVGDAVAAQRVTKTAIQAHNDNINLTISMLTVLCDATEEGLRQLIASSTAGLLIVTLDSNIRNGDYYFNTIIKTILAHDDWYSATEVEHSRRFTQLARLSKRAAIRISNY